MVFASLPPDSSSAASSSISEMPTKFISDVDAIYDRNEPDGALGELDGKGNNINQGFDGESVWLVPRYTSAPTAACTNFDIWIQDRKDDIHSDLAKGSGGDHRYLVPAVSPACKDKTIEMQLLRSPSPISRAPAGYSRISRDINEGRGGDHLYIIWKTWDFEPTPIPDGVYVIRNKASNTVVDLYCGGIENSTRINCCDAVPRSHWYFNQNWWIEKASGTNCYRIKNVQTDTCMEIEDGSSDNGAQVQVHQANGQSVQEWYIMGSSETGYSFFNVATGTVLDLSGGRRAHETPVIGYRSHGQDNQLWLLERRSFHCEDVSKILDNDQYSGDRFKHINHERVYILCPEEIVTNIWNECKSDFPEHRKEYESDDYAHAMKTSVSKWAYINIRAPVRLLLGVIFCTNGDTGHVYNWCLNQDLTSVVFFDPQSGRMTAVPEYDAYSGVY